MNIKWNREEFLVGALVGVAFCLILKWWTLVTVPACAMLWMLGGQYDTAWRRIGVPLVLCGCLAIALHHWIPLASLVAVYAILTMGYGIPSVSPGCRDCSANDCDKKYEDKGSALGRFVYFKLNIKDEIAADLVVRGAIATLLAAAYLPLAWFHVPGYVAGAVLLIFGVPGIVVKV